MFEPLSLIEQRFDFIGRKLSQILKIFTDNPSGDDGVDGIGVLKA